MGLARSWSICKNELYFYVLAIKKLEIDIFKTLFTIVLQNMKYLGTNPTKSAQDQYIGNYKILMKNVNT